MFSRPTSHKSHAVTRFVDLARKVPQKYREVGLLYTAALIFRNLVPFYVQTFYLCKLDLRDSRHTREGDPEIRAGIIPEDNDSLIALGAPPKFLPVSFESGTQFWILERGGQMVAYMWLEPIDLDWWGWLRVKISPNDICGAIVWVAPEHRGQGFGPRLNRHAASECARAGYSRIISTVDSLNRNSLRADRKVGYNRICHFVFLRFMGFTLVHSGSTLRLGRWSSSRPFQPPL
jgi:GNAT superfamily N-acetyltransferase